jgi:hypothetical protein
VSDERVFYRIIRDATPTHDDFKSHKELGKPLRDESNRRLWERAVSVYDNIDAAMRTARRYPGIGSYVAALRLPIETEIEVEQTGPRHHFTLFGAAAELITLVEDVTHVDPL